MYAGPVSSGVDMKYVCETMCGVPAFQDGVVAKDRR